MQIQPCIEQKFGEKTAIKSSIVRCLRQCLEFCAELGEAPDKPFSGKLPFRTSPEHHRLIFLAATKAGKGITWMDEVLTQSAEGIVN
jgi:predicted HicB family RNase H-like nuclease